MKRQSVALGLLVLAVGLLTEALLAQVTTATLLGTISDPSGAPVPGAELTVRNTDTGSTRKVNCNDLGNYVIADLPNGPYEIVVVKPGFRQLNRTGVVLNAGDRRTVDLPLTLGSVTETVTVSAVAPLLRTAETSLGQVIDNVKVQNMPLVGRSFDQLLYLVPGAQVSPTGQYVGVSWIMSAGPSIGVSFNGMRTEMNTYMIDGTHTNYPIFGTPSFYPSVETLEEFRVETQNFSSELSRTAGGQVMMSTKSGTNNIRGSVYAFHRNDNLEARNPFALTKGEGKSNLFGMTVGGPIIRNQTFFFGGYEGFRANFPGTMNTIVPTADDRRGVLTDPALHPNPIIDPQTGEPFTDNTIPSGRIDPIAKNILGIIPGPNTAGFPNFTQNTLTVRPFNQYNVRVDHNFGSFARLFGRWSIQPGKYYSDAFQTIDPSFTYARNQNMVIGFDANTAQFFNSLRFGHTRQNNWNQSQIPEGITPTSLGFPLNAFQANPLGQYFGIPAFSIQGYGEGVAVFGQRGGSPGGGGTRHFEVTDTMTLVRGSHTLKWGGNYTRTYTNWIFSNNERGNYHFDGTYTGDAFADFLLGLPRNVSRDVATPTPQMISNHVYTHFSDTWKVSPNLTIDYGLAYSYNGQPYEVKNQIGSFFIGPVDGVPRLQFVFGGDPRFPRSLMFANKLNFDPRLGIAWRPWGSQKTVIRMAAGRFHSLLTNNDRLNNAFGPPFGVEQSFQNPNPPVATLANAFLPDLIGGATSTSRGLAAPMDFKDATVSQWNFNIQREMAPGTVVQLTYLGNTAIHLDMLNYFNAARPGPGPFAPRRPYPLDLGPIFYGETVGVSTYHAFRAQVEKQFSGGWTLLSYYNFAKHIDSATALADGFGGQFFAQDGENLRAEKGRSSDDARHRFTTSYVYQVPVGKGRRYLASANPVLDGFLGGWQLAGVTTLMSGMPWSARQSGNRANRDAGIERPDRVCDGDLGSARTLAKFFDTSCYVLSPLYQLGNAGRDTIQGPGLVNFDVNVSKDFTVHEQKRLQFRAEFFNLTNTPYFGKPGNLVGTATFGKVTGLARGGTARTRIIQLALKFIF